MVPRCALTVQHPASFASRRVARTRMWRFFRWHAPCRKGYGTFSKTMSEREAMKKAMLVSALLVAATPLAVRAEDAKPEPEYTLAGNAGLFSDYRFRGFTQTAYGPAFQGGIDFSHKSGFYIGNWNSNVEQGLYNGASLE